MISKKVNLALKVASKAHRDQVRKGTDIPYISHPVAVVLIIGEYTTDEDVIVAGILHDVLEDVRPSIYSEADMRGDFGDKITDIVKDVSEDKLTSSSLAPHPGSLFLSGNPSSSVVNSHCLRGGQLRARTVPPR